MCRREIVLHLDQLNSQLMYQSCGWEKEVKHYKPSIVKRLMTCENSMNKMKENEVIWASCISSVIKKPLFKL